jgi:bifunctional non-homologous end joining protein LigD
MSDVPILACRYVSFRRSRHGLLGLVPSAVLEIHLGGSTMTDWERPDSIIMDLDPGDGVP